MKSWAEALLLSTLAVLAPIKPLIIVVGFLVLADTITGVWAAKKRKEQLTSARLRDFLTKLFIYQLCIIAGFSMEAYIIDHLLPVAKLIAGAVAVVEIKSLAENANSILGVDIFKELMQRLGSRNKEE